jgi:L-ascorbate metabolism protein UlaG (beta-lactamase superfamily)
MEDLPPIDLVLLTHAHFDHFHKPTLRRLPNPKIGIMPWGVGDLAYNLGFGRVVELEWWESFCQRDWKVTLTPAKHWGARVLRDHRRGYGGFVLEHQGRRIYHAGDSAYFDGFKEIGKACKPEIALLPIGAYHPESFRHMHMGPDDAIKVFKDLHARWLVPMHYGTFRLSFEDLDEPPRWLRQLAAEQGLTHKVRMLVEGVPQVF